mmetsp:Transcript_11650/g.27022  ORF Transcript_11650/g.27022 Transcript_11650/m.27022 type:complete len:233 (+) Transcript_11650:56-754(+)
MNLSPFLLFACLSLWEHRHTLGRRSEHRHRSRGLGLCLPRDHDGRGRQFFLLLQKRVVQDGILLRKINGEKVLLSRSVGPVEALLAPFLGEQCNVPVVADTPDVIGLQDVLDEFLAVALAVGIIHVQSPDRFFFMLLVFCTAASPAAVSCCRASRVVEVEVLGVADSFAAKVSRVLLERCDLGRTVPPLVSFFLADFVGPFDVCERLVWTEADPSALSFLDHQMLLVLLVLV